MVQTVCLLPHKSIVKIDPSNGRTGLLLVEQDDDLEKTTGAQVEDTLVQPTQEDLAYVTVSNMTSCSSCVNAGTVIGEATEVEIVEDKSKSHD